MGLASKFREIRALEKQRQVEDDFLNTNDVRCKQNNHQCPDFKHNHQEKSSESSSSEERVK